MERLRKQKEYNGELLNVHEQKQLPVAFELVLETNPRSNDIVIEVDLMLVQYMKQHQGREVLFRSRLFVLSFSRRSSIFVGASFRVDATDCCQYRSGEQRGSGRFRSHSGALHGSGQNLHHDHFDPHSLSLQIIDSHSSRFDSVSIEHGDQVSDQVERSREKRIDLSVGETNFANGSAIWNRRFPFICSAPKMWRRRIAFSFFVE